MRILDYYILKEYLRAFLLGLVFLTALVVVVRLLDKDIKKFEDDMSYWAVVKIVSYRMPRRIAEIMPVAGFLAAFFVLGRMGRDNQILAMKSAGISVSRIVIPIIVSTLIICFGFAIFYNKIASPAYHLAYQLERKIPFRLNRNIVFKGVDGNLFYIFNLNLEDKIIDRMTIYEFDDDRNLKQETFAKTVSWVPGKWNLAAGFTRKFGNGMEISFSRFDSKQIDRFEDPAQFARSLKDLRGMTLKELKQQIAYKKNARQVTRREEVRLHHKMAYPFAGFVVVLIAAPIAIRFGRIGFFAGLVIAFFLNFIYWGISFATFEGLSEGGKLHPIIACWGANVIYSIIGIILLWRTPK